MHEVVNRGGDLVVDHVGDVWQIQTPRSQVGGDEDVGLAFAQSGHVHPPVALRLGAVAERRLGEVFREVGPHLLGDVPALAEDYHRGPLELLAGKNVPQLLHLLELDVFSVERGQVDAAFLDHLELVQRPVLEFHAVRTAPLGVDRALPAVLQHHGDARLERPHVAVERAGVDQHVPDVPRHRVRLPASAVHPDAGLPEEALHQLAHRGRDGGGPEGGVAPRDGSGHPGARGDLLELVPETVVHHAVCLIKDKVLDLIELNDPAVQGVNEQARGRHQDVRPVRQVTELGPDAFGAVEGGAPQPGILGELARLLADLHGELARGHQHQRAWRCWPLPGRRGLRVWRAHHPLHGHELPVPLAGVPFELERHIVVPEAAHVRHAELRAPTAVPQFIVRGHERARPQPGQLLEGGQDRQQVRSCFA
mmetsp:Transcript_107449/g.283312  ORF Transcript_107449/g.283312 Transcript_107449/m.283312 type:complete len:422 (+) Transcript_107449:613-1878(+)